MNEIFDLCVDLLIWGGKAISLTYKEINVVIFVFLHPLLTLCLLYFTVKYWRLKKSINCKIYENSNLGNNYSYSNDFIWIV